jgi:hypothetical protein
MTTKPDQELLEEVVRKVRAFLRKDFPEIAIDAEEIGVDMEIAYAITDMISGDDQDDDELPDHGDWAIPRAN